MNKRKAKKLKPNKVIIKTDSELNIEAREKLLSDIILRAQEEAKIITSNRKITFEDFCERHENFTEEMYEHLIRSWTMHLSVCKTEEEIKEALSKIAELEEAFPRYSKKIKK